MKLTGWQKFLVMLASYSRGGLPEVKAPEIESSYRRYAKWASITIYLIAMTPVALLLATK